MSFAEVAEKEFNKLTSDQQHSIIQIMMFINRANGDESKGKRRKFPFDIFKDGDEYMAEDFDEIPEGFEEYA